jgi:hypothetical protein
MHHVRVSAPPGWDQADIESALRGLRRELIAVPGVEDATYDGAPPPPGAKADAGLVSSLLLAFISGGTLSKVVDKLLDWAARRNDRTVTLEMGGDKLELHGASSAEQDRLVRAWLHRHSAEGAARE